MDTLRHRAHDVRSLVREGNTNIPPLPRHTQNSPLTSELSDFVEAAMRAITVSLVVLVMHLAALEYIFLPI